MTTSRAHQATLAVWLFASLTLAAAGCSVAPFGRAPARSAHSSAGVEGVTGPASFDAASLTLTPVLSVVTGSREPHPTFSPDGKRLAFHAVGSGQAQHADDDHSQVHVLDLRSHEDHIVYEGEHHDQQIQPNYYDPNAPGYDPTGTATVVYDISRRPVFLNDRLLLVSAPQLGAEFDPPRTHQLGTDGDHKQPFGTRGTWPVVNADGSQVLLHSIDGITVVDTQGTTRDTLAGFFGVWAPDGQRLLVHVTPYLVEGNPGWSGGSWPGDIAVPAVNVGGLYLVDEEDSRRVLTDVGGRPDWLPHGRSFVYERPVVDEATGKATMSIFEYDLDTDTERELLVASARAPRVHPSGELMVYHDDQHGELAAVALAGTGGPVGAPRPLGVSSRDVTFSPDGRLLALTVAHTDRRGRGRDIVVYRLDRGDPPTDTPVEPQP